MPSSRSPSAIHTTIPSQSEQGSRTTKRRSRWRMYIFVGCASLRDVVGLPTSVERASFDRCTSLLGVAGLPSSVEHVTFAGCTSLISVDGLPSKVAYADFSGCVSLTRMAGLASNVKCAFFVGSFHDRVDTCNAVRTRYPKFLYRRI